MKLLTTILFCLFSACLTTAIQAPTIPKNIENLIQASQRTVYIKPALENISQVVGYQYLLFVIPFGRIIIEDLQRDLLEIAQQEFALKGFRMKILDGSDKTKSYYRLKLQDISLNAYDFLFIRKISAHVSLELTYYSADNLELKKEYLLGKSHSYRPFGFQRHLQFEYEKSLKKAWTSLN